MSKYHTILGISKSANEREIKRAYRTLVKQYHPDLNSSPDAEDMFLAVDEAYDYLTGKIKPKRVYKTSTKKRENREELRKEELEKRRVKAKRNAKMRYQKLKEEHEAFMSSPMLFFSLLLILLLSFLLITAAFLLFFVPIISYEKFLELQKILPNQTFDYTTFGAWFLILPIPYVLYRIFIEAINLFKDQ